MPVREREYGFAIVGCGVIAPFHARSITTLPNARLRAVVDVVPTRAERLAAEFGVESATDLRVVLDRPDIDVVCVCLPSGLHAEVGTQVAAAGKHLVLEKPIDVSLQAADRLIAACRAHGVKLTVISQHRFAPAVRRLREAVAAGRLGRPLLGDAVVKWYRSQQYYDTAGWRGTREMDGGGALINQAIHYVDLLQWMMGPVDRVFGRCATAAHAIPVEDMALAVLTFRSGALGVIEATTAAYPGLPERLEVTGTDGTVIIEDDDIVVWELLDERGDVGPYGIRATRHPRPEAAASQSLARQTAGHRGQLADLLESLETGRDPAITGEEARQVLALVLAVYASAETGREVRLPLD
ncbi:MAG TPA: Gfo/Idh/MocA family oxidoreductase [bacterium]|nr:Gfo/Idh/MocA family oxidoreductase [bacterium]